MQNKTNTLSLDFKDNPELKAALGGLEPGDRVTIEIELMTSAVDGERFEAVVEGIAVEGEAETEDEEGEPTSVEPSADEPVMVVMAVKGKGEKPAAEDAE